MLIYHFQSGEGLFEAVLEELRIGQLKKFEAAFEDVDDLSDFKTAIKGLWRQLASEQSRHYMLAYLEIQILEIRQGKSRTSSAYLNATLESWLSPIAAALVRLKFSRHDSRIKARAILSGGRGLILDWLAAGTVSDQRQVQSTFDCLVDSLF